MPGRRPQAADQKRRDETQEEVTVTAPPAITLDATGSVNRFLLFERDNDADSGDVIGPRASGRRLVAVPRRAGPSGRPLQPFRQFCQRISLGGVELTLLQISCLPEIRPVEVGAG